MMSVLGPFVRFGDEKKIRLGAGHGAECAAPFFS